MLGKLGCEVIPAFDGQTALKRMKIKPPDIILLGCAYAGNGRIRNLSTNPGKPSMGKNTHHFSSPRADDKEFVVRALSIGGVDYINNPVNHAELSLRLQTPLALKATLDRLEKLAGRQGMNWLNGSAHDLKKSALAAFRSPHRFLRTS